MLRERRGKCDTLRQRSHVETQAYGAETGMMFSRINEHHPKGKERKEDYQNL
jgi:hypothetical protein